MMERSFSEALKQRRTYYSITNQSPISDQEIECIVNMTVRHVPSAFNSQTTRAAARQFPVRADRHCRGRVLGLHAKGATGRGDPDRTGSALRSRKHFSPRTEP